VVAIAALIESVPFGLAASSFTTVSLSPALASVCIAHTSTTWPALSQVKQLGLSILDAGQEQICKQLSARSGDRFAGVAWRATADDAVLLEGAAAWFVCSIEQQMRAGDHDIILLRVHELGADAAASPLIFHRSRFRRLAAAPSHEPGGEDSTVIDVDEYGWP
jgi:flavin reductase (DIM6/NTAB) family NADH-FMN oxidoreductase RutF